MIVVGHLDDDDAAAGALQLGDLLGLAHQHVAIGGGGDHLIAVVARRHAEHLVALLRLGVAAAGTGGDLLVRRGGEAQAVASLGHRQQHGRHQGARIEGHRRDDLLAVAELEVLLRRVAVAGGGGDVVDLHHVGGAAVGEEDDLLLGGAGQHERDLVALAGAGGRRVLELADALDPAVADIWRVKLPSS